MIEVTDQQNKQLEIQSEEQEKKIDELTSQITKQTFRIEEMEKAFLKVEKGREAELEDVRLIYFDREHSLLNKYKSLQKMFDDYRKDILREFTVKEEICKKLIYEKEQLLKEISMAKYILSEKELY